MRMLLHAVQQAPDGCLDCAAVVDEVRHLSKLFYFSAVYRCTYCAEDAAADQKKCGHATALLCQLLLAVVRLRSAGSAV